MTLSIVARCERTGELGVGAVTATPGVGMLLTWARTNVGAVATQAWLNPYLGIDAIALLSNGHTASRVLDAVVQLDEDRELRQVGVVDASGRSAAFTGSSCEQWAGHLHGEDWSIQGNVLAGGDVVDAAEKAWRDSDGEELVERLIRCLEAGEGAGGDRRGSRSATVFVVASEHYPLWDLRIDDDEDPVPALRQLRARLEESVLPQIRKLPTRLDMRGGLRADDMQGLV